jgi:hypothetical protein
MDRTLSSDRGLETQQVQALLELCSGSGLVQIQAHSTDPICDRCVVFEARRFFDSHCLRQNQINAYGKVTNSCAMAYGKIRVWSKA